MQERVVQDFGALMRGDDRFAAALLHRGNDPREDEPVEQGQRLRAVVKQIRRGFPNRL